MALSAERLDHLANIAAKELGPAAEGMLYGEPIISELRKHAASYTTLKIKWRPPSKKSSSREVFFAVLDAKGAVHPANFQQVPACNIAPLPLLSHTRNAPLCLQPEPPSEVALEPAA